jgi:hypothetical protein
MGLNVVIIVVMSEKLEITSKSKGGKPRNDKKVAAQSLK